MEIVYRKLSELKPNPKNPRKSTKEAIEKLAHSISENPKFFEARPILLSDRTGALVIIGGERRSEAAALLKMETVPTILMSGLTEAQEDEILIKDNTHAGVWDEQKLQAWGKDQLQSWNVDGVKWAKPEIKVKDDNFDSEKKVKSRVKPGELWQLGKHRLMCGDSTDAAQVAMLMGGGKADLSFTSPPYNAGHLDLPGNERTKKKYQNDDDKRSDSEYIAFLKKNVEILLSVSTEVFYNLGVVSGSKRAVIETLYNFRDNFKDFIYWKKSNPVNAICHGVISSSVELILCFGENNTRRFKDTHFENGEYYPGVIEGSVASSNEYAKIHKATFPVYLPENIIKNFSSPGSSVFDCFGGTGTTLIASEQLNRKCYMMEIDPHYCDVIIDRWEQYTGQKAKKIE